jgi:hypothetical protein
VPRYETLYARGAYAPPTERDRLSRLVRSGRRAGSGFGAMPEETEPGMAAPPPEQASLF